MKIILLHYQIWKYMRKYDLSIGLDIDEVLANWSGPFFNRFKPKNDADITRICSQIINKDRDFWLNLPVIQYPIGFEPKLYCTKRSCLKVYSKEWLDNNDFPHKPVYQVFCQTDNKARYIKGRIDVFIDDSPRNVIQMNKSGVPTLLMNTPFNQDFGPILRIYSLDYEEILDTYYLAKEIGIFNEFDKYF